MISFGRKARVSNEAFTSVTNTKTDDPLLISCLSSDTKPQPFNNSLLFETDTGKIYHVVLGAWVESKAAAGPTGLTGPIGPTGIQGIQGIDGPTGPAGVGESLVRLTSDSPTSTTVAMGNVTGLVFSLQAGVTYEFGFCVIFKSFTSTSGLRLGLTFPSATIVSASARIPISADGAAAELQGWITTSGDSVMGTAVQAVNTDYLAMIDGIITPSANGNLQVQSGAELSGAAGTQVRQSSFGRLKIIP